MALVALDRIERPLFIFSSFIDIYICKKGMEYFYWELFKVWLKLQLYTPEEVINFSHG